MEQRPIKEVEVVRGHCLGHMRGDVYPGEILKVGEDLSLEEATAKIVMGHVVAVPLEPEPPAPEEEAAPEDEAVEEEEEATPEGEAEGGLSTGDPVVDTRDPGEAKPPKKKSGGKKSRKG